MDGSSEQIEYWYVEQEEYPKETHSEEIMFDQSHDQINLQMIEIEGGSPEYSTGSKKRNQSCGRPGRKAAVPDEALDEKALNRRNRRRMRNREAAQRQRDRRVTQLNQLQENNKSLIEENDKLKDDMKKMDEKYKRALFKIQTMQKLMTNSCACKNPMAKTQEPSPLGILNGAQTKESRKRSSIELPIVKMTLKPSQQPLVPNRNHAQGQPEAKIIPKVVSVTPESPTPEKTINKYIQYLKTGPFETLKTSASQKPNLNPPRTNQIFQEHQTSLEPPMKKPKLINSELDFQSVFADVFLKKPENTVDITKTANASEGAISNHSSVHKFC